MDLFNLTATITLNTSKYDTSVRNVSSSATELGKELTSMGKEADSAGKELDSLGGEADSTGKELDSLGKEADAAGQEISDLGSEVDSVGGEADGLGQEFSSMGQEAASAGQEFSSLGGEAASLGQELGSLGTETSSTGTTFTDLGSAATDFGSDLESTGKTSTTVSQVFKGTVMGGTLVTAAKSCWGAITNEIGGAIDRYDTLNNYVTVMENLGYSTEDAEAATNALKDGVTGLPTTLDSIASWQQMYTALSGDIEGSTDLTLALNDATLAGGQGQEVANSAMQAWYNIIAQGKPTSLYWQQLVKAMPAQLVELSETLLGAGASSDDLYNAWQEGTVTTEEVEAAIVSLDQNGGESFADFHQQALDANSGIATSMTNLQTSIKNGIAGVIEKYDEWAESNDMPTIAEMIAKVQEIVTDVFTWIQDHLPQIMQWIKGILPVVAAVVAGIAAFNIIQKIQSIGKQLEELGGIMNVISENPMVLIVAAIAAIVMILIELYQNNEQFRDFIDKCWEVIKNIFETCGEAIMAVINAIKTVIEGIVTVVQTVVGGVREWLGNLKTAFQENGGGIQGVVKTAWQGIQGLYEKGYDAINNLTGGKLDEMKELTEQQFGDMKAAYDEHGGGIKGVMAAAMTGIKDSFKQGYDALNSLTGGRLGDMLSTVKDKMTSIATGFKDKIVTARDNVKDGLDKIKGFFTDKLGDAFSTVKDKMKDIADKFGEKMDDAREKVHSAIEKIKGFFDFDWSLPEIKLPHFSISGSFSLNPPSIPTFSVDWYAKAMNDGMILNGATIFGANGNTLLGGGEVGSEVVVGADSLMGMIENASAKNDAMVAERVDYWCGAMYGLMSRYMPQFENMQVCLDTGATVGGLAPAMNKELGKLSTKESRR